jgi:hypothetical protein
VCRENADGHPAVIARSAATKQSRTTQEELDCFVASAPRNDDVAAVLETLRLVQPRLSRADQRRRRGCAFKVLDRKHGTIGHFCGGEMNGARPIAVRMLEAQLLNALSDFYPCENCANCLAVGQVNHAPDTPRLNPHLTKSRLNDAPRLCEMFHRNFSDDGISRAVCARSCLRLAEFRMQPGRGTRWNQSGCKAYEYQCQCVL